MGGRGDGRVGSALDNVVIESWQSTLDFELRRIGHFGAKAGARARLAVWIAYPILREHHTFSGYIMDFDYTS